MKKFFGFIVAIVITIILVELTCYLWIGKVWHSNLNAIYQQRTHLLQEFTTNGVASEENDGFFQKFVLHPYLGFVLNPKDNLAVNSLGFLGDEIPEQNSDTLRIVITGGSVARIFFEEGRAHFKQILEEYYPKRKIKLYSAALGGYKQPQQLILLNYLLFQNKKMDVLINIDGFNEVALPYGENIPAKVNPFYPRLWNHFSKKGTALYKQLAYGKLQLIKQKQLQWSQFMETSVFKNWHLSNMVWVMVNNSYENKLQENFTHIQHNENQQDYQTSGPNYPIGTRVQFFTDMIDKWEKSSIMMHQLCQSNGIKYLHFLQPNQYLLGSKVFTPEEKKILVLEESQPHTYRKAVKTAYPNLIERVKTLRDKGVDAYDLSAVFKTTAQTIYIDDCCHFNVLGNQIMGNHIANTLGKNHPHL